MASMDPMLTSTSAALSSYHHNVADFYPRKLGPKPDVVPSGVTERKVGPLDKPDMVAVDVINVGEHDIPHVHNKKHDAYVLGTIHPFRKTHRSFPGKLLQEFRLVTSDRRSWRILLFGFLNLLCTACLLVWCSSTNSMALTAYTYLTIFDLFSLITCLISSWVSMKKPSQVFSFGFDRLEVLAVFASTVLVQLGALFILKESVERFVEQPEVHTGRLLVGTFVALFFNLLTLMSVRNKPFACVSQAASSSWLQEHVADLSRSLCGMVPGLSSVLLPRMNPFVLINLAGALSLCVTYMLIEMNDFNSVDTASAVAIALMTFGTMYPMSVYSGKVLLQTTPSHIIGQLDKLLREVSTLDGVLEVRNEHFWTLGFGSLAGSAHVRIRRDANEQLVLAHVTNRLLPLVSTLTVQIFKDDWTRPLLTGALSPSSAPPPAVAAEGFVGLSSLPPPQSERVTSTPSKPSSPPPEFSFETPGRNVQPVLLTAAAHQGPRGPYGGPAYAGALPGFRVPGLAGADGTRSVSSHDYRNFWGAVHHHRHYTPK
ncbi:zinc transporter 6 [Syngnathoides biaculeatus]|uniref:zinc transporter 6 n=1 Tax=Syngnathoides biaculeatus TaxID=300417 RepID=UPI002ADE76FD|nr:zinc transporter 6 [Syngnathoides biaculeatus]